MASFKWILTGLAALVLWGTPGWAWGPHGHRITARVALDRLTPEARRAVQSLLLEGDTLVDISTWADSDGHEAVPGSAPWHYVNVPISVDRYGPQYCGKKGCVVSKIKEYRAALANPKTPLKERRRALLFLVHFVGDVHQPLHVGDNQDRGGNLTQVQFLSEGTNLHRLWDSGLINQISRNERDWMERIEPLLTPANVKAWSRGGVDDWATESLRAARSAYHYPEGARQALVSGARLDKNYVTFARPLLELRLAQAGVRLANELNAIFR